MHGTRPKAKQNHAAWMLQAARHAVYFCTARGRRAVQTAGQQKHLTGDTVLEGVFPPRGCHVPITGGGGVEQSEFAVAWCWWPLP